MALANDDGVIKAFPSDRADQPLRVSVLPRRPRRNRSVADAHGPDAPDEGSAIRAVAVADQVAWRHFANRHNIQSAGPTALSLTVKRAIALEDGPTILVGLSYGGVVITEVGSDPTRCGR